ncbi:MAG: hypothetical protein H0W64_09515 [Gammaproteobacteria bacterium]|nr:hypothetical protein [Gammaproteobacteria bacterium]
MGKITLGYDDNLGLPSDFAAKIGCEIKPYHDLSQMIDAYDQGQLAAMFIPAGTLPYISQYEIIAQALFGPDNKSVLQSNFVTTKNMTIEEIKNFSLGRVNEYCTTSYWAPLIYLIDLVPQDTVIKFVETNGFEDLLLKTASGAVDGSTVWDIYLEKNPTAAKKVHELFHVSNLPTPIIIGNQQFPSELKNNITQFQSEDHASFFHNFTAADLNSINQFKSQIQRARRHFNLKIDEYI